MLRSRFRPASVSLLPLLMLSWLTVTACDSGSETNSDGAAAQGGSATAGGTAQAGAANANAGTSAGQAAAGAGGNAGSGGTAGSGTSPSGAGGTAAGSTALGGAGGSTAGGSGGAVGGLGGAGTTGGAGSSSAGTAGAAGNAGGGSDPCATALYCDDFESYTTAPNGKWTTRATSGAVAIDTNEHVSGMQSVKFSTQSAGSATAMMRIGSPLLPVDPNVVYGRMLFRLAAAPTASVHWTIIAGLGVVPGQTYHSEYRYGGQIPITSGTTFVGSQMMANYETPDWYSDKSTPGSDCWHHSNARVIPVDQWTCIEWKYDGPNNGMQLWLDNLPADDLTIMGHGDGCVNAANDFAWTAPTFSSFDLGWESYQQDDPRTAWIDDVVISKTKVGCP